MNRIQGPYDRSEEYWVDPETRLPVKIVIMIKPSDAKDELHGAQIWTLSGFKFDQPLDEKLFSTDPPEGYLVEEDSVFGLKAL